MGELPKGGGAQGSLMGPGALESGKGVSGFVFLGSVLSGKDPACSGPCVGHTLPSRPPHLPPTPPASQLLRVLQATLLVPSPGASHSPSSATWAVSTAGRKLLQGPTRCGPSVLHACLCRYFWRTRMRSIWPHPDPKNPTARPFNPQWVSCSSINTPG